MIKIQFPSLNDLDTEVWFEQMELSLFHAKKAYEKFKKTIPEEKQEDISLYIIHPGLRDNKRYQELLETEQISYEDSQEIELVISY